MKDNENQKREALRATFQATLMALGFSPYIICSFFYFLVKRVNEVENMIKQIDGVVQKKGDIMLTPSGDDHFLWIRRQRRYELTRFASFIAAMTTGEANDYIKGDLALAMQPKLTEDILTKKNLAKKRATLYNSFLAFSCWPTEKGCIDQVNEALIYWRGQLDAHRIGLRLSGNSDRCEETKQSDLFMRILEQQATKKRTQNSVKA